MTAVVVGGGLAGISAALRLVDAGVPVTLVEARRELGGATYSFRRGGRVVDTGQHVFLRCYTEYLDLLRRLGSTGGTRLQARFAVPVLRPGGGTAAVPVAWLRRTAGLPAPAHLLPGLAGYRLLRPAQRLRAMRAALALRRVDPDDPGADELSFGTWLAGQGQDAETVDRLWGLICVAALNAPPQRASLALAARVFRTGLLERADAADIGRPAVPLSDLHGAPARRLLAGSGATVLTRTRVCGLRPGGSGFTVELSGGREVAADAVVLAVPHPVAATLVPAEAAPDRDRWAGLGASPIVNVHVLFARRVTDLAFGAAVDSPVQWFFDRTDGHPGGQYLVVSLSAAEALLDERAGTIGRVVLDSLADLLPLVRNTPVTDLFVTREPRATFRQAPGTRALRPASRTRLPGLALAGAWVDTGWPDTMEGAVRSGRQAADVVREHLSSAPTTMGVTA